MYIKLIDVNESEYLINFDYVSGIKLIDSEKEEYAVYVNNEDIQYVIVDKKRMKK